jgi:hypothetical protein
MLPDRRALVAAAVALSLACSRSVTEPSSTLQFAASTYTFTTILNKDWCVTAGEAPASALSGAIDPAARRPGLDLPIAGPAWLDV